MLEKAKQQFSNIEFMVCDALALPFENEFDVVFSNSVFRWISDHDMLLKIIHKVLKPQGLLVCEFGASGNISVWFMACYALTLLKSLFCKDLGSKNRFVFT